MNPNNLRLSPGAYFLAAALAAVLTAGSASAAPPQPVQFNRDIRPVLSDRCFACHGPDPGQRKANLRLDVEDGLRARRVLVPGRPEQSTLFVRVSTPKAGLRMPPAHTGKTLSAAQIGLLRRWIAEGARYQPHWAYIPPSEPKVPAVRDRDWCRSPIDSFILARIEAAGRKPSPEADRITLLRRLSFDLTGLPPTPPEVESFLGDRTAGAYERQVDRLLASPRFGERMAQYWLDLVRYADTVGYHGDQEHAISPYRDWVIKAFNDGMPFDRFTVEQLAGDLLPNPTVNQRIATGYNRLLQTTHEGGAQDGEYRVKYAADRIRNVSGVWMGATVGCAECHDHKYDPYTQKDFYSLGAIFADIQERGAYAGPDVTPTKRPPELEVLSPFDQAESERLLVEMERVRSAPANGPDAAERTAKLAGLQERYDAVQKRRRTTMVTVSGPPRTVRILKRGDWMDTTGEIVQPAIPSFLARSAPPKAAVTRLDLARWLTSPDHPQTSRVWVNRMWYLLFGDGLCRSLDDFGAQGKPPTHPELLDWLAARFAKGDSSGRAWDTKALIRLIVTSAAYRQSSANLSPHPAIRNPQSVDPENLLFARQGRFRLPAEMIRDTALSVSGLLVERLGGPGARPYQPEGYYELLNFPKRTYQHDKDQNQYRRGVYVHWQRQYLHPMLRAFDAPSREECTAQRPITNTPLAALTLLNDPSMVEAARALASRILREGGTDEAGRIRWAWRLVLSRSPSGSEVAPLGRLYHQNRNQYAVDPAAARQLVQTGMAPLPQDQDVVELAAWTAVARALLNLSETITRS